jgi:hypothetical protein
MVMTAMSCQIDWDRLDPSLGAGGSAATGGGGEGGATTTSSGGGGSGGMAGAGGMASGGAGGGSGGGGGVGGAGGGGGAGGAAPVTIEYDAAVADCIFIGNEDPDLCASVTAADHMTVDGDVSAVMLPAHSYLRFDLDGQLTGKTVTEVRLRLTAGSDPDSESSSTGELWEVEPFTRMDLFTAAPATVSPLGGDQGAVMPLDVIEWVLSPNLVSANASVFFGLIPVITNGVDYWNADGLQPPKLVITVE